MNKYAQLRWLQRACAPQLNRKQCRTVAPRRRVEAAPRKSQSRLIRLMALRRRRKHARMLQSPSMVRQLSHLAALRVLTKTVVGISFAMARGVERIARKARVPTDVSLVGSGSKEASMPWLNTVGGTSHA